MSLFKQYVTELTAQNVLENDIGFIRYEIKGLECFIHDVFIIPKFRESGYCYDMADEVSKIAKSSGCQVLIGSVIPTNTNSTKSLKVLLGYGMKLHSAQNNFIMLSKEL